MGNSSLLIRMRSLILAATATLAVLSGIVFYSNGSSSTRFLSSKTEQVYTQQMLDAWTVWKMKYGKTYGVPAQEEYRKAVFMANYHKVNLHNSLYGRTWDMGLNYFADMPAEEFAVVYTGFNAAAMDSEPKEFVELPETSNPKRVDWTEKNAVTDVKNQGHCGSCWSFSTTGAVEGANAVQNGKLTPLSEQQLVDCAGPMWGNHGCKGGLMNHAFKYIQHYGLESEGDYAYSAKDTYSCRYDASKVVEGTRVKRVTNVRRNSKQLESAIAKQPVAVAIYALSIQLYHSGVYHDWDGCDHPLDHGVLAVGYENGEQPGASYW